MALVAIVGWSLVRTAQQNRDRAEWAAQRDARDLLLAMRAALRREEILGLCEPDTRFELVDGTIQTDPQVGWLRPGGPARLDWRQQELLQQAQQAEFAQGDPVAAATLLDKMLAIEPSDEPSATDTAPLAALSAAAWQAQRAQNEERTARLVAQLDARLTKLAPKDLRAPGLAGAIASATLLRAARGQAPSEARWSMVIALPSELCRATMARLDELGIDTAAQRVRHERIAKRRQLLNEAAEFVRDASHRGSLQSFRGQIALWFATQSGGYGALQPPSWLKSLPGLGSTRPSDTDLPPIPDRGSVAFVAGDDNEPLLPGVAWIAKPALPRLPWFAQPTAILGAGIGLLLLFGGSVWATMRGLSRETAAMRARTEFLSGVTHELKTPVASMRLIADVLHDDEVPKARQREYFAMLAGESARLSALIENVLDLGQMERGERAYDLRDDDAVDVVREAVQSYAPLADHHGMQLELHEGVGEAPANIDRGAILQALLNLFENARKYASAGKRIDVHTEASRDHFVVRVRDHGPGVPSAERERIFTRFQRGAAQQSGSIAGVGLGLFLSRSIVARHRGTLTCTTPADGPGSVFELSLPLRNATQSPPS